MAGIFAAVWVCLAAGVLLILIYIIAGAVQKAIQKRRRLI